MAGLGKRVRRPEALARLKADEAMLDRRWGLHASQLGVALYNQKYSDALRHRSIPKLMEHREELKAIYRGLKERSKLMGYTGKGGLRTGDSSIHQSNMGALRLDISRINKVIISLRKEKAAKK